MTVDTPTAMPMEADAAAAAPAAAAPAAPAAAAPAADASAALAPMEADPTAAAATEKEAAAAEGGGDKPTDAAAAADAAPADANGAAAAKEESKKSFPRCKLRLRLGNAAPPLWALRTERVSERFFRRRPIFAVCSSPSVCRLSPTTQALVFLLGVQRSASLCRELRAARDRTDATLSRRCALASEDSKGG